MAELPQDAHADVGNIAAGSGREIDRRPPFLLFTVRLIFVVLLVVTTMLTVSSTSASVEFDFAEVVGTIVASAGVGLAVLLLDALTPNKRLTSIVGVYLGVCLGLVAALAVGSLIDTVAGAWGLNEGPRAIWLGLSKVVVGLVVCYLSVSVVLTTKDDFRLVIPYVEFSRQTRGVRPILLDTSVLIDGRVEFLGASGLLDAPLLVPRFVVDELQALADSPDRRKRLSGKRGLDVVGRLQADPKIEVSIDNHRAQGISVDRALVDLARREGMRLATTDSALAQVAAIHQVQVINLHDLSGSLRPTSLPGDLIEIEITRVGEQTGQGVGHLPDGTMVVVEAGAAMVGQVVSVSTSNSVQTSAGRIIFARIEPSPSGSVSNIMSKATNQPKVPSAPQARRRS
ncbi:MAG: PIN/TRAM domain-containing protein [Phycisphaerales bacterium]|nr:PIN/TRAM domain-containing protein [Phycisphaerales bacterium]